MHVHSRNTSNVEKCTCKAVKRVHYKWLAIEWKWSTTGHWPILDIQWWPSIFRQSGNERYKNHHTSRIKQQGLEQLYSNHMGIEKTIVLVSESTYCINMSTNIKSIIKHCSVFLGFQQMQPEEKIILMNHQANHWKSLEQICCPLTHSIHADLLWVL